MSGDLGPRVAIAAAIQAVASFPELELLLVGDEPLLRSLLVSAKQSNNPHLNIVHASDVIAMDEDPLVALRHKKQSSMWRSLVLLQDGVADACVSAGNTGALMAISKHLLKMLPGIDRPAICKSMPVEQGSTYMLDLGANLSCTSEQLHQFAVMGSVLASSENLRQPKVALLNIGTEDDKGTEIIKKSHCILLADSRLNYTGFIEGNAIFRGLVDVVVCDGFSGNIALKASEGLAQLIKQKIEKSFTTHWYWKLLAIFMQPLLRQWSNEISPAVYNGASFLGLQKTVVKSHGGANQQAFFHALAVAREQVIQKIPERIKHQLFIND